MNYFLNMLNVLLMQYPPKKLKVRARTLLAVFASGLQWVDDNIIVPWGTRIFKLRTYDGSIIMLERLMNLEVMVTYNPNTRQNDIVSKTIIYIKDKSTHNFRYLFNKAENRAPVYMYNRWKPGFYSVGNRVWNRADNGIYRCIATVTLPSAAPNTNPAEWKFERTIDFWFNKAESGTYPKFIVWVPLSLGGTYETSGTNDNSFLRGIIDTYRKAGSIYLIKRY